MLERRVVDDQAVGEQGDLSVGEWRRCAVAEVARNGVSDGRHLGANLVVSAGFEAYLDQGAGLTRFEDPIGE
jgi:hypothetical protein